MAGSPFNYCMLSIGLGVGDVKAKIQNVKKEKDRR
jgi:hypothetical protein